MLDDTGLACGWGHVSRAKIASPFLPGHWVPGREMPPVRNDGAIN
jgi:hypothetical protein